MELATFCFLNLIIHIPMQRISCKSLLEFDCMHHCIQRIYYYPIINRGYCVMQRCIQSASLRPGTHSFFFWTQRILNEGSNWTQKKNRMFMQITNSRKKQRHTIRKFVFRENNFYKLIDSSGTVYFAVNFQTKAKKPLCFLITFLSR